MNPFLKIPTLFRSTTRPQTPAPADNAPSGNQPLVTEEPITDNRLVILALLEEVADILQLNLYSTQTYHDYQMVLNPASALQLYFNLSHFNPTGSEVGYYDASGHLMNELYDQEQMWLWIMADRLPPDFRTDLVRHLCQRDELEEHIAELSQTRYERLRNWTANHA